jgi:CheY-like chemotaxis protein
VVFRSCHPLIVDDDPDFVLLLKRCLVKLGVPGSQIQACPDGNAALKLLCMKDFAPSLVILDHKMPMLTGLEVPIFALRVHLLDRFGIRSRPANL